ncbi:cobalamin biosynthesis protein CbiD [Desulfosporosinus orientis DSM 765]|uniref:Cobalt-precorrin-5B C(1)-methyltransferase n=1 Tax=Desulfosporosinus orientis (strain ATCC 19365 / DSM 765 / NCIMB 8382 / VKM B-1628 / Singapore I) TaxID=768706 RepID=G7WBI7_DESOD|nr:cobalt-precorrin-5B (C(1))-methyltransferase CbiD [Desulfosporosinus orientis]AET68316.1 cobalamin biosynthesis protein CbiD [Desulfosporosinus orientis DSM 765]
MARDKDRHNWREGYTTGSCAAGAAKAACLLLKGENLADKVEIPLPSSARLTMPIHSWEKGYPEARACILKDGGDDADITHGLEIQAIARYVSPLGEVGIQGGQGVGKVTKKGLAMPVGESAINPVPRRMIMEAVREVFPAEEIEIIIEVPAGETTAQRTLNPRLGVVGGISILGTSGIVRPMSEEAFKTSILPELDQAVAYGHRSIVLTPGHYGFRVATEGFKVPAEAIIQMSNFVGYMLEEAAYRGIEEVILLGHVGKLIKVSGGIFHTHNRVADARMEVLLAHAALSGLSMETLKHLAEFPTTEGAATELLHMGEQKLLHHLAHLASERAQAFVFGKLRVGTIMTLLDGRPVGWDIKAQKMVKEQGWTWAVD